MAARRRSGAAVTVRAIRALPATVAITRPVSTAARTAALRMVRPLEPVRATTATCPTNAASISTPTRIAVMPASLVRVRLRRQIGHGSQQPVDVGAVVVVDQAGPDRAAGVAQAQDAGQFPGVVVTVPHVDVMFGQVGGYFG